MRAYSHVVIGAERISAVGPEHGAGDSHIIIGQPVLEVGGVDEVGQGERRRECPNEQNPADGVTVRHSRPQRMDNGIVPVPGRSVGRFVEDSVR